MRTLLCCGAMLAAASCLPAKTLSVSRLASPPVPVAAGQEFSLCAANVGNVKADILLQLVSVRTGSVIASREITLLPPGAAGPVPDPCITATADAVMQAGKDAPAGAPPLVVAIAVVRQGFFGRHTVAVSAGLGITAAGASGAHRVATIPLQLATNLRDWTVESVP